MQDLLLERLKNRVERRHEERKRIKERESQLYDRINTIKSTAEFVHSTGYYCNSCHRDVEARGHKVVYKEYAWYKGKCVCGAILIRRITDKSSDPYYRKSQVVLRQSERSKLDLISPDDPLFQVIYPKQWEKIQKEKHGKSS